MEAMGSVALRSTARSLIAVAAVLGVSLAAALSAWGTFGDPADHSTGEFLATLAIMGVAALVVFGWVVPRALRRESVGVTALVLSVLGLATIAVFWTGLPPILAAGGIALGLSGWNAPRGSSLSRAAVVVGLFVVVGDLAVYVQDMT